MDESPDPIGNGKDATKGNGVTATLKWGPKKAVGKILACKIV